jgi:hypothetical protein
VDDSWAYADGFVEESTFDDEPVLDISLFLAQDDPACEELPRKRLLYFEDSKFFAVE